MEPHDVPTIASRVIAMAVLKEIGFWLIHAFSAMDKYINDHFDP